MEEISKKDLLILTGISYGQLYRWKRKGLIPEEWFIKRASFTGQETFFPKDLVLERIDRILELKEEVSLEELSEIINKKKNEMRFSKDFLWNKGIFSNPEILEIEENKDLSFNSILLLKILDNVFKKGRNIKEFYQFMVNNCNKIIEKKFIYLFFNDGNISAVFSIGENLEYNPELILKMSLNMISDNLKLLLYV